ncbi:ATP synthase F1 subunit delta [Geoalkalibacter halelectricus]|uniref:ATP synthase subunit delta n=1 Tax=Geoalkalibacter halelectricus TaxID=2847045 RepID=A0ABY5ZR91_9BACT|nr:ATP synthase F1 subunit delta [Geoalkalibacter halelectricus]MDO3378471.1 ATP synthase F1 subunit delta [Geoalkalibacter halelectricus]UWZ80209.1 ATP synthase F1 subunit delta [Geoalkalibacter halelectricus]
MSLSAISKRYARALIQLGSEQNKVEEFAGELDKVQAAFAAEKNLRTVLESPAFPFRKRAAVLTALGEKLGLSEGMRNFLGLLLEKQRLRFLPQIAEHYQRFADELSGTLRARLTSAVKLDAAQAVVIRTGLQQQTGKKIILDTRVDPSLIGGIKAEFGGRIFDGSLSTQLKRFEDKLTKG